MQLLTDKASVARITRISHSSASFPKPTTADLTFDLVEAYLVANKSVDQRRAPLFIRL